MWTFGLILALAFSSVIGEQKCGVSKSPFVGPSEKDVFPWVALLYYDTFEGDEPTPLAMGTLVDSRHVLVPAHATSSRNHVIKYVQFGTTILNDTSTAQNYDVEKEILHPEFKKQGRRPSKAHDIAIIRLAKPISSDIVPACLPETGKSYDADVYYFVYFNIGGDPDNKNARNHKRISLLPRIKPKVCENTYTKYNKGLSLSPSNISTYTCAGDTENDSCRGDAGSPLLLRYDESWTAVAFTSFGPTVCRKGIPSVFLNIQPYVDWIKSVISQD